MHFSNKLGMTVTELYQTFEQLDDKDNTVNKTDEVAVKQEKTDAPVQKNEEVQIETQAVSPVQNTTESVSDKPVADEKVSEAKNESKHSLKDVPNVHYNEISIDEAKLLNDEGIELLGMKKSDNDNVDVAYDEKFKEIADGILENAKNNIIGQKL